MAPRSDARLIRTTPRWGRVVSAGAAAAVTATALAGTLGYGPGAAAAQGPSTAAPNSPVATGTARRPAAHSAAPEAKPPVTAESRPAAGTGPASPADSHGTNVPAHRRSATKTARQHLHRGASAPSTGGTRTPSAGPTALPRGSGSGRRIVYDVGAQRVWLVAPSGVVEHTYLVSGPTRPRQVKPGRYAVTSMTKHESSRRYHDTVNDVVRFTGGRRSPVAFEDIPATGDGALVQSQSQLGTPTSEGAIRQWFTDAEALWSFAHTGTTVVVVS